MIAILLLSAILYADDNNQGGTRLPYDIGDVLPDSIHLDTTKGLLEPTTEDTSPAILYPAIVDGIKYFYQCWTESDPDSQEVRYINWILVKDSSFISPEGLRVGNPIVNALKFSEDDIIWTPMKIFVQLPSGWNAALLNTPSYLQEGKTDISIPIENLKIQYFFRYSKTKSTSKYMDKHKIHLPGYN
jgi:hypothetical protein